MQVILNISHDGTIAEALVVAATESEEVTVRAALDRILQHASQEADHDE